MMVVIRFSRYKPTIPELQVKTPITAVARRGDEVEIEFDGDPSPQELEEIAQRLGLPKIKIVQEKKLIRRVPKPKKIVFVPKKTKR